MECFKHVAVPAAGICKSCGKGVCRSCAIEVTRGLACSEQCEAMAESLSVLQAASLRNVGVLKSQRIVQPLFAFVFMAAGGWFVARNGFDFFALFLFALGAAMAISAIMGAKAETPRGPERR
ncbi:MAG TPA: hypothetical protein VFL14_15185 [Xanthomonadales bacterium]|nr:hypothetical protein [Xanthomonadales bacterium]